MKRLNKKLIAMLLSFCLSLGLLSNIGFSSSVHDHAHADEPAPTTEVHVLDVDAELTRLSKPDSTTAITEGFTCGEDFFFVSKGMRLAGATENLVLTGADTTAKTRRRIQTNGSSAWLDSSNNQRVIKFETTAPAKLEVWYDSQSGGTPRAASVRKSATSAITEAPTVVLDLPTRDSAGNMTPAGTVAPEPLDLLTAGVYLIGGLAGVNIYYVRVTVEVGAVEPDKTLALDASTLTDSVINLNGSDTNMTTKIGTENRFMSRKVGSGTPASTAIVNGNKAPDTTGTNRAPANWTGDEGKFTKFIHMGGKMNGAATGFTRALLFDAIDTATKYTFNIWATSTSASDTDRQLNIFWYTAEPDSEAGATAIRDNNFVGTKAGTTIKGNAASTIPLYTFTATHVAGRDYVIGGTDGSRIYYVEVVESFEKITHEWSDYTTTLEPTCTAEGSKYRVCTVHNENGANTTPGDEYEVIAIPKLGHSWSAWTTTGAPAGKMVRVCTRTGCTETQTTDAQAADAQCQHTLSMEFQSVPDTGNTVAIDYTGTVDLGKGFTSVGRSGTTILRDDSITTGIEGRKLMGAGVGGTDIFLGTPLVRYKSGGISTAPAKGTEGTDGYVAAGNLGTDPAGVRYYKDTIPTGGVINFTIAASTPFKSTQVHVWALGGGSSNTGRSVALYRVDGDSAGFVDAKEVQGSGEEINVTSFEISAAGDYRIAFVAGAINVYHISIEQHTWESTNEGGWDIIKEATCDTKGEQERTCTVCEKEEVSVTAELTTDGEHTYEWVVVTEAGHGTSGTRKEVCTTCGDEKAPVSYDLDAHTHKVTLKNGDTELSGSFNVTCNTAATKPSDPELDGYNFVGWYTDKECTKEYDFSTKVTGDLTLYAKFEKKGNCSGATITPGLDSSMFTGIALLAAAYLVYNLISKRRELQKV